MFINVIGISPILEKTETKIKSALFITNRANNYTNYFCLPYLINVQSVRKHSVEQHSHYYLVYILRKELKYMYGFGGGCCGYGGYGYGGYGYGRGFALIVVLFILLIIVGASWAY